MTSLSASQSRSGSRRLVAKPWGHEVVLTDSTLPYAGKLLHIHAGYRLSLQVHDVKTETLVLLSGAATLLLEIDGQMTKSR